jgi:large subunit ribosomal protein L6
MSRIGKSPVPIASGVNVTLGADNIITVKGPKGELKQAIDRDIKVEVKSDSVELTRLQIKFVTRQCMVCIVLW